MKPGTMQAPSQMAGSPNSAIQTGGRFSNARTPCQPQVSDRDQEGDGDRETDAGPQARAKKSDASLPRKNVTAPPGEPMRALGPQPQQQKQSAEHELYEQAGQQDGEGVDIMRGPFYKCRARLARNQSLSRRSCMHRRAGQLRRIAIVEARGDPEVDVAEAPRRLVVVSLA